MLGVLSSEWTKLRAVRSTYYVFALVAAAVLLGALVTWQGVQGWDSLTPERRVRFQGPPTEQMILPLVQLCLAVLGALAITSEYATGLIRSSLVSVPRRAGLLAGKAIVVGVAALIVGLGMVFATFVICRGIVGDRPIPPGYTTPAADEIPMLLTSGLSVMVIALVGLGVGTILRSTAGAIAAVCGLLFVVPLLVRFLPAPWNDRVGSVLLPNLAGQIADYPSAQGVLSPSTALAVTVAYLLVGLGAGALLLSGRDA
ncbi:ABC transporter permease subunit [Actinopolymorpha alba]|uniref:ABC transporter permease subunit n=1 Tax=Actinopolymorpha alba TaxID=533267 RepID=UPI00037F90E0|nr:ABC transporter permease [Actinopolymorpha alba]